MFKGLVKDLYESIIENNKPRITILEAAKNIFEGKPNLGVALTYKYPYNSYFNIKEAFTLDNLTEDRKKASVIYKQFKDTILQNLTPEERDIYYLYNTHGDLASFKYDIDEQRIADLQHILRNNTLYVNTMFGDLSFEFTTKEQYNASNDTLLAYEDELNRVLIFVSNPSKIKLIDLINILRRSSRFIHELTHYIDKIEDHFDGKNDYEDSVEYLNLNDEFKANMQSIIYDFARYIFKNIYYIRQNFDLRKKEDVLSLFNLHFLVDNKNNVVDNEDLEMHRKQIYYLTDEKKNIFYNELCKYITNELDIDKPFEEAYSAEYLLKLFRLEESFIKLNSDENVIKPSNLKESDKITTTLSMDKETYDWLTTPSEEDDDIGYWQPDQVTELDDKTFEIFEKEVMNPEPDMEKVEAARKIFEDVDKIPVDTSDLWKHERTHYREPHLLELMDEWGVDGTNYADFRSVIQEHCFDKGLYAFDDIEKTWKVHQESIKNAIKGIKKNG